MSNLGPKAAYFAAKKSQFKSVVQSAKDRKIPVRDALIEAGYRITTLGSDTLCLKGRAVVCFSGNNVGEIITLPHYL